MEMKIAKDEFEFQVWFPEICPQLWENFNIESISIVAKEESGKIEFRWDDPKFAPRKGAIPVHVNWSGKNFDEMRGKLHLILRTTMFGNFADTYCRNADDLREMVEEIKKFYPNTTVYHVPKGIPEYSISVQG